MIKILFVCHGNICRSPMAEFIFKKILKENGREDDFFIASAATSTEELGNPVYPPARAILAQKGIDTRGKYSVRVTKDDYEKYDMLICMDQRNLRNLSYITGEDTENKVSLLMDYALSPREISDPWYSGDFQKAYNDILEGCIGLYKKLKDCH